MYSSPANGLARGQRRTKILATVGPATRSSDAVTGLIDAGVDIIRINFSHGTPEEHAGTVALIRQAAKRVGREVGILGDLPGPKIRLGDLVGGRLQLESGHDVVLTTSRGTGTSQRLPVGWDQLPAAAAPGGEIYLADGRIRLRIRATTESEVRCTVEVGGTVTSRQGLNVPEPAVALPATTQTDLAWVDFAIAEGVDLLAVSFVRRAADLEPVQKRLRMRGADIPLIAKIETAEAVENANEIVSAVSAGVMIARGDLGIELPIEQLPAVQKRVLDLAGCHSVPSITATQMLASMVAAPRPTRAEVSDVANAIYQGTDALMLSEETAVGAHPVEAVRVMDRVARSAELDLPHGDWGFNRPRRDVTDVARSVARAAVGSSYSLRLAALVVPTQSGRTARLVSAHRPQVPILAVSPRIETVRRLNLLFGVRSAVPGPWQGIGSLLEECARMARDTGAARSGELIGITGGLPSQELGTNLFEVHRVP